MFINGQTYSHRAHHVVWHTFHGSIPDKHYIMPKDGDWENIAPKNLECIPVKTMRTRQWEAYNQRMDEIFEEMQRLIYG